MPPRRDKTANSAKALSNPPAKTPGAAARASSLPSVSAEAALSFLKDTKGALTWSTGDLADALKISRREAELALGFLQAQGYVQRERGSEQWMTTPAGESVSGAKTPRFTAASVEQALAALRERILAGNKNGEAPFRVSEAVAFGDFLERDRARVQAAEVGIGLTPRGAENAEPRSATEAKAERAFLRQLRGGSALLTLRPYAEWMRQRTHRDLLARSEAPAGKPSRETASKKAAKARVARR